MSEHDEIFNLFKDDTCFINYEKTARALSNLDNEMRNAWDETLFHSHLHKAIDDYLAICEWLEKEHVDIGYFVAGQGGVDIITLYRIFKEIVGGYYE